MKNYLIIFMKAFKFASVSAASGLNSGMLKSSHQVTARSVRERKMLPFDQVTAVGSASFSFATVVPLPVQT